jgi:hypothetical protein
MCNAAQVVVRFAEKMLKAGFDVNDSKEEEFEQHGNYVADEQYQIDEKLNDYRRSGSITPNRAESSRSSMEPNPKRRLEEVHEPYYRPGKQLKQSHFAIQNLSILDSASSSGPPVGHKWTRATPSEMYSKFNQMHHILILCGNWPKLEDDPEIRMMRFFTQLPYDIEETLKDHKSLNPR